MNDIFVYTGYLFLILNLVLFFKGFSKNGKAFKLFGIYTAVIFAIQLSSFIMQSQKIHNLFLSHFYFTLQFIFLSLFYYQLITDTFQRKIIKIGLFGCCGILFLQYGFDPGLFFKFNLFEIFITSFLIIIYASFHFYNQLNEKKDYYWINMGIIIYLFGSTVLFLAGNLVAKLTSVNSRVTWILNAFLYIVYQLFILAEFIYGPSKIKTKSNDDAKIT